jgi:hypothetical protein
MDGLVAAFLLRTPEADYITSEPWYAAGGCTF